MCDKSLKYLQEVDQILKTALKDDLDQETKNAKVAHLREKLTQLKQELENANENHKKELKQKDKEINKLKKSKGELEEKLAESAYKNKQVKRNNRNRETSHSGFSREQDSAAGSHQLQRQIQKKRDAQEKAKEYKIENEELKRKLEERQRQNQILKEQIQNQRILLDEFARQEIYENSSNDRQSNFDQDNLQQAIALSTKMMDMSEGSGKKIEEEEIQEPLKPSEDLQTDDQQYDMQDYASYESDQGSMDRRNSEFETEEFEEEYPQKKSVKSLQLDLDNERRNSQQVSKTQSIDRISSTKTQQPEAPIKPDQKNQTPQENQHTTNSQSRTSWWKWLWER